MFTSDGERFKTVRLDRSYHLKYILLLTFILFCNHLFAQRFYRNETPKLNQSSEKLKQGKWVELSGDGVKSITHYKDDMLHGLVVKYWDNGNLKSEAEYRNDILHGFYRDFYRSGSKNRQGNYQRGLRNGIFTKYWENVNIRTTVIFENDLEHGDMLEYYKNGTLKRATPFVRGVVRGEVKTYNKKGKLVKIRVYVGNTIN
jgi:antitoxin component YwqK of YwqJK toxin-antitoxin module